MCKGSQSDSLFRPGEAFHAYRIFDLSVDRWNSFLAMRTLVLAESDLLDAMESPRKLDDGERCLVWPLSAGGFERTVRAEVDLKSGSLILNVESPLNNLRRLAGIMRIAVFQSGSLTLEGDEPLLSTLMSIATQEQMPVTARRPDGAVPAAYESLVAKTTYEGPVWICSCGIPGDGSRFAWIESGRPMLSAYEGPEVQKVVILPRVIDA